MEANTERVPTLRHCTRRRQLGALWPIAVLFVACACSHKPAPATENVPPANASPTSPATAPAAPTAPAPESTRPVQAQMRNVLFHLSGSTAAHIETLSGEVFPTGSNAMPNLDDKNSFELRVKSARISVSPAALAGVMNDYVFAKADSPLKDMTIYIEGDRLHVKGKLHSKGDVPFESVGSLSPTSDGRIRVHSEKVKAFKVSMKGIMNLFGIDLANVLDTSKVDGIDVEKNDLILDMSKLLPPPHIQGKVTAVRIEKNTVVTIFGTGEAAAPLEPGNYMAFKGNKLRFGSLIMDNADITVLDLDPADPLDWFQEHYKEQLVAGYSKITPSFGLRAYVKDFAKLSRGGKPADSVPPQ